MFGSKVFAVALLSAFATQTTFAEVLGAEVKPVCAGVVIQHLSDAEIAFVGETLASTHNAVHAAAGDGEVIGSLTYSDSITLVGLAAETTPSLKQGGGGWGGGIGCGITCPSGNDDFYGDDFWGFLEEDQVGGKKKKKPKVFLAWEEEFTSALNAGPYSALYSKDCTIMFKWTDPITDAHVPQPALPKKASGGLRKVVDAF